MRWEMRFVQNRNVGGEKDFFKLKLVLCVFILMIGIPAGNDACLS